MIEGRSIALVGDTGSGKTTQIGELAKHLKKTLNKRTRLNSIDRGGYKSLNPLIKLGVIELNVYDEEKDDPWTWLDRAASGKDLADDIGLVAFDGGTSAAEVLLNDCARLGAAGQDIGGRPTPKLIINKGTEKAMRLGTNVDTHYGVVQQYVLEKLRKASYLTQRGFDTVWTFSLYRGEGVTDQVLGMKLVGRALTALLPKEFQYTFRLAALPTGLDTPPEHVLYLTTHNENGMVGFGNARYALDADTPLPSIIKPASVVEALFLIEQGEAEAERKLREELGM